MAGNDSAGEVLRLFAFRIARFGEFGHAPEIGAAPLHPPEDAVEGVEGSDDAVVQENEFIVILKPGFGESRFPGAEVEACVVANHDLFGKGLDLFHRVSAESGVGDNDDFR